MNEIIMILLIWKINNEMKMIMKIMIVMIMIIMKW